MVYIPSSPAPVLSATLEEKLAGFADPRFRFEPGPHEYYLGERRLTSVTSWLKRYKEPFYSAEIAPKVAASRGCTTEEVLAEWERAAEIGTKTHQFIEDYYNHVLGLAVSSPPLLHGDGEVSLRCLKFLELASQRLTNYAPVAQELRLFHEASSLCGTLDMLARHTPTGQLYVLDWKTSRKIATDQDTIWRYMWLDFADLADHEHNVYSLQISLYRLLLEAAGIETAGGAIVWLPTGATAPALIPTIDYRNRLRKLLF